MLWHETRYTVANVPELRLDILDVGQGDGLFVWLPNGKTMMVDYGSTKNKEITKQSSFKYFQDHTKYGQPNQVLDWLVLTHGDRDHYNLVSEFLTTFKVDLRNVFHGGLESDYASGFINWLRTRRNPDLTTPTVSGATGAKLYSLADDLGATVTVLAAGVESGVSNVGYKKNTRSVVLRIDWKNNRMLLTGDATRDTELQIVSDLKSANKNLSTELQSTVLKVAHHGSHRTSNYAPWLQLVNPEFSFISSDRSGSLDEDQKPTGHRLPQSLTIDLLLKYASRVHKNAAPHHVISSYQQSDYESYNWSPDFDSQPIDVPTHLPTEAWIHPLATSGIWTTLIELGLGNADADVGEQWQVVFHENGGATVMATRDAQKFTQLAHRA